jgi:hypothetical protein
LVSVLTLMLVPTLVTVIIALGTNPPDASFTSPVIVAVSCCANVASGQMHNNMKKMKLMQRDNCLNISFPPLGFLGHLHSV